MAWSDGESEAGEGHGGHNKEEGRHQIALGFARDYQQDRSIASLRNVPFRGQILVLFTGAILFLLCMLGVGLLISTVSSTQVKIGVPSRDGTHRKDKQ